MDPAPLTLFDAMGWAAGLYLASLIAIVAAAIATVWRTGKDPS